MPELPDLTIYLEALQRLVVGQRLERIRLASPFLLRTVEPPLSEAAGKPLREVRRIGKRIVFGLDGDLFLIVHLMIAGRFHWKDAGAKIPGKIGLAAFDFRNGSLLLTEAGTKKRAALHLVCGERGLDPFDTGGVEPLEADFETFHEASHRDGPEPKTSGSQPICFAQEIAAACR
jgi:formamidopyrimidine-DNA glycosylase